MTRQYFTTKQTAAIFAKSVETIRLWAKTFGEFLDPLATPEKGKDRNFTENDLQVFALVAEYKNAGNSNDEIAVTLRSGERGRAPDILPEEAQHLVSTETERRLVLQVQELHTQLRTAYEERDQLKQEMKVARELESKVAGLEAEVRLLRERLSDEQALLMQIGELRGELRAMKKGRD